MMIGGSAFAFRALPWGSVGDQGGRSNALSRWWEGLTPLKQGAMAGPLLVILLFLANLGPFNQPLWRSILYGIFEGGVLTGLLLVVTHGEKKKREGGGS
jgi:hypothetical protein